MLLLHTHKNKSLTVPARKAQQAITLSRAMRVSISPRPPVGLGPQKLYAPRIRVAAQQHAGSCEAIRGDGNQGRTLRVPGHPWGEVKDSP